MTLIKKILDEAMPLSQFLFDKFLEDNPVNSMEEKVTLIDKLQPYLFKLPDSILKNTIIDEMSSHFGVTSEKRLLELQKLNASPSKKIVRKQTKITPVRLAIALLLEHPHIVNELEDISVLEPLDVPGVELLSQLLQLCQAKQDIKTAQLLEYFRDTEQGKQLAKLMCWEHHVASNAAADVFLDSIEKLLNNFVEKRTEFLLQKARIKQITHQERQELLAILNG